MAKPALPLMQKRGETFARLEMDEDRGGLRLPDKVGTQLPMIVLRVECIDDMLETFSLGQIERLPAKLINEKGCVHSDAYEILNVLGYVDCLDVENSDMDGDPDFPAVQIFGKYSLLESEIPPDLDIFRPRYLGQFIFSERLVSHLEKAQRSNFFFKPVKLS